MSDEGKPKHLWPPPLLEDWCAEVDRDPTPEWLLKDLIPGDAAVMVSGRAKIAYKSWFANAVTVALATGKRMAELHPGDPGGVNCLVLALEGPRKSTRRRWDWQFHTAGSDIPAGRIWFAHRYPIILNDQGWRQRVRDFVASNDIRFVVIDTLAKASTGDENSVKDVSDVMRSIDAIRSAGSGTSVMYLHHLRKASQQPSGPPDIDDEMRGSSALSGFYDVHLAFRETGGKGLTLIARQKDEEEMIYRVEWDIQKEDRRAALKMEKYDPDAAPEPSVCWDKLSLLEEGKVYSYQQLVAVWELPAEVVAKVLQALITAATVEKTAKGYRRIQ